MNSWNFTAADISANKNSPRIICKSVKLRVGTFFEVVSERPTDFSEWKKSGIMLRILFIIVLMVFMPTFGNSAELPKVDCAISLLSNPHFLAIEFTKSPVPTENMQLRLRLVAEYYNTLMQSKDVTTKLVVPSQVHMTERREHVGLMTTFLEYNKGTPPLPSKALINPGFQVFAVGDVIIRAGWNDSMELNRVFEFEDTQIVRVNNLSTFLFQSLPSSTVNLIRNMSRTEFNLWKQRDLKGLLENGVTWDYSSKVSFFQLGSRSRIGTVNTDVVAATFIVSRDLLVELSKRGWVSAGATELNSEDPNTFVFEVVVKEAAWSTLSTYFNGEVNVNPLTKPYGF